MIYVSMNGNARKIFALLATFQLLILSSTGYGQQGTSPPWVTGRGSATGTDFEQMRTKALNAARADAMRQLGIEIKAMELLVKGEVAGSITDFYSQFAESATRGLILDERNFVISDPVRVSDAKEMKNVVYRIDVQLDAHIALQQGERDLGFEVKLSSDREVYQELEPVFLRVTSTRDGYLTIFNVHNDSLSVVFPNAIDKDNAITAHKTLAFPPRDIYSLGLTVDKDRKSSEEILVAIVSRDDIPFPNVSELRVEGDRLKLKQDMLTSYAKWLYKIPVHRREADAKVVQVVRKDNR